jgi:hypothetical protein
VRCSAYYDLALVAMYGGDGCCGQEAYRYSNFVFLSIGTKNFFFPISMVSTSTSRRRKSPQPTNGANSSLGRDHNRKSPRHNRPLFLPTVLSNRLQALRIVYAIFAIFLLCWGLIIYIAIKRFAVSSPSDYPPSRKGSTPFILDERFSIPCPSSSSSDSLEDTVFASTSAFSVLHAIITPFWFGQSSQQQNQTLRKYQNTWARARFKMMEAICAPTIRNQTLPDYFWIAIVDEGTLQEPNMTQDLTKLFTEHNNAQRQRRSVLSSHNMSLQLPQENAYLLLYRNLPSTMGSLLFSWPLGTKRVGWYDVATEYRTGNIQILVGEQDSWDKAMQIVSSLAAKSQNNNYTDKSLLVMETMLYVDSGLHHYAVEWMQTIATRHAAAIRQQHQQTLLHRWDHFNFFSQQPLPPSRWYISGSDLIEWHNPDILLLKSSMFNEQGISVGRVGHRVVTEGYPLAGLTSVWMFSSQPALGTTGSLVETGSAKILHDLPLCQGTVRSTDCLLRVPFPMPIIMAGKLIIDDSLASMTIQDFNNMKPVQQKMDGPIVMNRTEPVWEFLEEYFGIDRYHLWQGVVYLYEHAEDVLSGHPCMFIPTDDNAANVSAHIPGCSEATRDSISKLSKYVHIRRTMADPKPVPLKNAKNPSVKLQAIKKGKKLTPVRR